MKTMKAAFLVRNGKPETAFEIRETAIPGRKPDEFLIKVEAFGLNFADVMARLGFYRDAPPLPAVLGYDLVGRVVEAPEGQAEAVGKRVAAMSRFGAYAEYAVAIQGAVFFIPEGMDAAAACALGTQYCTAWHAAFQATAMNAGDTVLIHAAAGGVGTALVQLAMWKGCTVVAMAGSDSKIDELKSAGVHYTVNYRTEAYEEVIPKLLGGKRPIDLSFNAVGGTTFKKDMKLLRPGGRLVLYGASERTGKKGGNWATYKMLWQMGIVIPLLLVAGSRSVIGVNVLRIADYRPDLIKAAVSELTKLLEAGVIRPKSGGVYPIDQLADAHRALEQRQTTGKLAVKW